MMLLTQVHALIMSLCKYGYHTSALNQLQAVLTCKVADATAPLYYGLPTCISMSDATFSVVTSVYTLGGFFGSLGANIIMDRYGRKGASRLSAVLTAAGSSLFGLSSSVGPLILGRYVLHTSNIFNISHPQISCWSCSRPGHLPLSNIPV
jgi:MFS family permease